MEKDINEENKPTLLKTLITFYDEFVVVQNDCVFLCESASHFLEGQDVLDLRVINGFGRQVDELVCKMTELKKNLRAIVRFVRLDKGGR